MSARMAVGTGVTFEEYAGLDGADVLRIAVIVVIGLLVDFLEIESIRVLVFGKVTHRVSSLRSDGVKRPALRRCPDGYPQCLLYDALLEAVPPSGEFLGV